MDGDSQLLGEISGAVHQSFGGVEIDVAPVGDARIKRLVYPPGLRWSVALQPLVGTASCEHAHAGFLAQGALRFEFPDGCVAEYQAPAVVDVAPGHDAEVVSDEPAVLIEIDFLGQTVERLGLSVAHDH